MPTKLLIIGHVDDPEFAGTCDWLSSFDDVTIERTRSLADHHRTRRTTDDRQPPDIVLVLERHPDEHAAADVIRLIEQNPLARIVCGYGPWSESAARTRGAWPPIAWTPTSLLREHVLAELAIVRGERRAPAITADRTDAFESRYAAAPAGASDPELTSLNVALEVPDAEYRLMLEDDLLSRLARIVNASDNWDVLLFDAQPEPRRLRELRNLLAAQSHTAGRIIILHELPCASIHEGWSSESLGTALDVRVVSKLAPLSHL